MTAFAELPARHDPAGAAAAVGEPRVGRAAAIGATIGFVVALVTVTVAGTAAGFGAGASFGLGVFVGLWGGVGFGFMAGATVSLSLHGDHNDQREVDNS